MGLRTQPHHANPTCVRGLQHVRLPTASHLLLAITQHVPVQAEYGKAGVLAHAAGYAGIQQAHHG
ncbi:hypothetical protein D3C72_2186380 [compost metagenome]